MHTEPFDLEIALRRGPAGGYEAEARARLGGDARKDYAPCRLVIDRDRLRGLVDDDAAYGLALSDAFFSAASVDEGTPGGLTLRAILMEVRGRARTSGTTVRLRLKVSPGVEELHDLYWELLRDPEGDFPISAQGDVFFSRYMAGDESALPRPKDRLRALVSVAGPADLKTRYQLEEVFIDDELELARSGLGELAVDSLPSAEGEHCSLERLTEQLRAGYDVLYLACHGAFVLGEPYLYLEDPEGCTDRISGAELVERLRGMTYRPRLVVLASCESAGKGTGDALRALGPQLMKAGVPAVVAMQGPVSVRTVAGFLPVFFHELNLDGQIDRAMAAARLAVRRRRDWWSPVLYMRLESGRLWSEAAEDENAERGAAPVPIRQISAPPPDFVGRETELETLCRAVNDEGVRCVSIHGLGGTGKTTLALKLVECVSDRYPDAQLHVELFGKIPARAAEGQAAPEGGRDGRDASILGIPPYEAAEEGDRDAPGGPGGQTANAGQAQPVTGQPPTDAGARPRPMEPAEVLARIIHTFEPARQVPQDIGELQKMYRSLLSGKRTLILLEDALGPEQPEALYPPPVGCLLVVTTRRKFLLPGSKSVDLNELSQASAERLLRNLAPRVDACPAGMVMAIVNQCGRMPMAIRFVAGHLRARPNLTCEDMLRRLRDDKRRLNLTGEDASLQGFYEILPERLRNAWRKLAVFTGDFDARAAAALWGMIPVDVERSLSLNPAGPEAAETRPTEDYDDAEDLLGELIEQSLVEYETALDRYRLPELPRTFALQVMPAEEAYAARVLHAAHYLNVLAEAERLYLKGGDTSLEGLALIDREMREIRSVQAWSAAHPSLLALGPSEQALDLPGAPPGGDPNPDDLPEQERLRACAVVLEKGEYSVQLRISLEERLRWARLGLAAARLLADLELEGRNHGSIGNALADVESYSQAIQHYEQHLAIARQIRDPRGIGVALGNLGSTYTSMGEAEKALKYTQEALELTRTSGTPQDQATLIGNLGVIYEIQGDLARAEQYSRDYLKAAQGMGDLNSQRHALGQLGRVMAGKGDTGQAIALFEQSLQISRDVGNTAGEAYAVRSLGDLYRQQGEMERALACYTTFRDLARQHADANQERLALQLLADFHFDQKDYTQAIALYESLRNLAVESGNRESEALALFHTGKAYYELEDWTSAVRSFEQSLPVYRALRNRAGEGRALLQIGMTRSRLAGRFEAERYFELARLAFQAGGDPAGEANASWQLGVIAEDKGEYARAAELMQLKVDQMRAAGDPDAEEYAQSVERIRRKN